MAVLSIGLSTTTGLRSRRVGVLWSSKAPGTKMWVSFQQQMHQSIYYICNTPSEGKSKRKRQSIAKTIHPPPLILCFTFPHPRPSFLMLCILFSKGGDYYDYRQMEGKIHTIQRLLALLLFIIYSLINLMQNHFYFCCYIACSFLYICQSKFQNKLSISLWGVLYLLTI